MKFNKIRLGLIPSLILFILLIGCSKEAEETYDPYGESELISDNIKRVDVQTSTKGDTKFINFIIAYNPEDMEDNIVYIESFTLGEYAGISLIEDDEEYALYKRESKFSGFISYTFICNEDIFRDTIELINKPEDGHITFNGLEGGE